MRLKRLRIAPPEEGLCPVCAVAHAPSLPHDRDSLYYQMSFHQKHGHWPSWESAMDHCTEEVRAVWREEIAKWEVESA